MLCQTRAKPEFDSTHIQKLGFRKVATGQDMESLLQRSE